MKSTAKNTIVVIIFSIAMAALESAVVVYLRAIYYKDGFTVAYRLIDKPMLLIEIAREAATLVMILCIGYLTGKTIRERLAYFLICFAVWDIFYYVWLKVFINWPASVFDWDILFLIPFTWLGPVLSPLICSVTMLVLAAVLLRTKAETIIPRYCHYLIGVGSVLILFTYLSDYGRILIENDLLPAYADLLQNDVFIAQASAYIPEFYNWPLFAVAEVMMVAAIYRIYRVQQNEEVKRGSHVETQRGQMIRV